MGVSSHEEEEEEEEEERQDEGELESEESEVEDASVRRPAVEKGVVPSKHPWHKYIKYVKT